MRVLTFQSANVINTFKDNNICYPINNIRFNNAPKTYKHLLDDYNKKKNCDAKALFYVWAKVFDDDDREMVIDDDHIYRCNEMTYIELNDDITVAILLEVPDELILVTNFYNYSDEMYAEEFPNELESIWDSIYNLEINNPEQQGVIPYITKDMIIDIKILEFKD